MKNFFCALALLLFVAMADAQTGIQFTHGTWSEVLEQAEASGKLIFMDAYTTWCGPCKKMSREVFTDEQVGAFYNEHFINVKMDMERGEGLELARRYNVRAYPTLLFLDADGQVVHRAVGYRDTDDFLGLGQEALDPERRLGALDARYARGDRDPEFLYKYLLAKANAYDPAATELLDVYLNTQDDWSTRRNMEVIFRFGKRLNGPAFRYLMDHLDAFEEAFGERAVRQRLEMAVQESMANGYVSDFGEVERVLRRLHGDKADELIARYLMNYHLYKGETDAFARAAVEYMNTYKPRDPGLLNSVAWSFYEHVDDPALLRQALKWARKSVKLDKGYANTDTVAALYYKLGKTKQARKWAEKAIALAKASDQDYTSTAELLEKIEAAAK